MRKTLRTLLAFALTAVMLFATVSAAAVAALPVKANPAIASHLATLSLKPEERIQAIIVLKDEAVADLGYKGNSEKAIAYEKKLIAKQNVFLNKLESDVTVSHRYTELLSGFGVEATVARLMEIEAMPEVKGVYYANTYTVPKEEVLRDDEIEATIAAQITGAAALTAAGYSGDGILVAVVDTGLNLEHETLQPNEFIQNPALTEADLESIETLYGGAYINEKVPFSFDYYDLDDDCTDENGHGSHVAGIIGGYCEESGFCGAAPGVQICGMKVFGVADSTTSLVYFDALEDCYRLNVDIVNMSLGAPAGYTYDYSLETDLYGNIYEKLDNAGITVFCSAGNETDATQYNLSFWNMLQVQPGMTLADMYGPAFPAYYTDYGIVGSPSTYPANTSVASADNACVVTKGVAFAQDGEFYVYTDPGKGTDLDFEDNLDGETPGFVYLSGLGNVEDFEDVDVEGKLVAIDRGGVTFQEKIDNAAAAGAAAVMIVNNVDDGTLTNMSITDQPVPAIFVVLDAKDELLTLDGGEVTISFGDAMFYPATAYQISSFSSRGPAPDLAFKPEITGIGGNVYSCDYADPNGYVLMSGTSMACPNVVGTFATILQYVRELAIWEDKYEQSYYAEQMMLSTADLLANEYEMPYTPRMQGAGLADAINAVSSGTYLLESTISAGDDPEFTGEVELEFLMLNLTGEEHSYLMGLTTLLDEYMTVNGLGCYNTGISVMPEAMFESGLVGISAITVTHLDGSTETDGSIVLAAGEMVDISVTVSMHPMLISALIGAGFDYGFFFDGFVSFYDELDYMMHMAFGMPLYEKCHASFISYIGDWTEAPAMESVTSLDMMDLLNDPTSNTYMFAQLALSDPETAEMVLSYALSGFVMDYEIIHNYTGIYGGDADDSLYFVGMNIFQSIEDMMENGLIPQTDCVRFTTPATNADDYLIQNVTIQPSMLRNTRHLIAVFSDSITGEVYYVDDTEYVEKDIFDYNMQSYLSNSLFQWDGSYIDETGRKQYVPSGTVVDVGFYSILDYHTADLKNELSFSVMVDYTAPEIFYDYDAEAKTVTLHISDNDMLAYVEVYDDRAWMGDGEDYVFDAFSDTASVDYVIDVSDSLENGCYLLYVDTADYATNLVETVIPLYESCSNIPVAVNFDLPDCLSYMMYGEEPYKYATVEFDLYVNDDDHCLGEDFNLVITQGEDELEPIILDSDTGYICICVVLTGDEPVTITADGVMEHDFQPVEIMGPDCTFKGLYEYCCSNCGHFDHYGTGTAKGHTKDEGQIIVEPTCTECGWIVYHCTECGDVFLVEPIACVDHVHGDPVVTKEADYGVPGETTVYCTECGAVISTSPIDPLEFPDGDVNGDGAVDAFDYMLLKTAVLGTNALTADEKARADVNADHCIDAFDYAMLKARVLAAE